MIQSAFCDDDQTVLAQLSALLENIAPSAVSRSSAQPFTARWIC